MGLHREFPSLKLNTKDPINMGISQREMIGGRTYSYLVVYGGKLLMWKGLKALMHMALSTYRMDYAKKVECRNFLMRNVVISGNVKGKKKMRIAICSLRMKKRCGLQGLCISLGQDGVAENW